MTTPIGHCKCCDETTRYGEMVQRHGTLSEFSAAIWRATDDEWVDDPRGVIATYKAHLARAMA